MVRSGPKLLYFFRGEEPGARPSFAGPLEEQGWEVDCEVVSDFAPVRGMLDIFRYRRRFADYDVIAASEYFLTWAVCLRLLFRSRPKVVALSFNQSSTRMVRTGIRPIDWILNRVWRRIALFTVHSHAEARLFAGLHDIPINRFVFLHWGFDLPDFSGANVELPDKPYVIMVGRNNRDIATFCEAVERAGVQGVLITASYMLNGLSTKSVANVRILVDRPFEECLSYVNASFAHLVLVSDAERGAGHISAVSAMLLGKPQIFSDVEPLADYLIDDFNGIAVAVGDADAVAGAIRYLKDDSRLTERLGSAGRSFALEHMSAHRSARRTADALVAAFEGRSVGRRAS
jgi:glycosyltransferase involved in cell wall biosynthesis